MATNSYSAGNLEMQIQAVGSDATASLSSVNSQLQTMVSLLGANVSHFKEISTTARSMSRMTFNWTKKLADGLNNITTIDTRAFYKKMQSLTRIMQPFVEQLNQAQVSLVALQKVLASTRGKRDIVLPQISGGELLTSTPKQTNNVKKTLSFASIVGKLYFIRNYTKQIGQGIANMVQNAINYTETLNLWQVAMRNNRLQAEEFVETMNKAYGISEQTLMNYQATFKNMLSALGGISEGTSYALSEYLTQMALDYASLYNTSIERAMTVFQSVLSGQVRPIRSISGYDITETTIFQLYQQLGGTKTMRQLTQTEKRLLRIYAVFQQMENSGTIGDLNKTLGNSANQLRILSEGLKELGTWFGIIMEMWLKPILPYLNAFVITLKNIIQAIAIMNGYVPFEGAIESVEEYNEALDETTGKLLSFDRFEALNPTSNDNGGFLGVDESLLAGLSKYKSILGDVENEATKLAKTWTEWWVDPETGELTSQASELLDVLKAIGITLGSILAYNMITKVGSFIGTMMGLNSATKLFSGLLMTGIVYALIKAIDAFKEGDILGGVLATTIGVVMVAALVAYKMAQNKATMAAAMATVGMEKQNYVMLTGAATTMKASAAFKTASLSLAGFSIGLMGGLAILQMIPEEGRKTASIIMIIAGAVLALTAAIVAMNTALSWGTMLPVLLSGVGLAIAGVVGLTSELNSTTSQMQTFKTGGLVEDGIFTMNKGEIVGQFDDGSTVVANNQQIVNGIKQGVYSAVVSAMNQSGGNKNVGNVYIDGRKVGIATAQSSRNEMVRTNLIKANK